VDAYRSFKDVEKLARVITIDEVREADYNLSPSRFVSVAAGEKYRDINEIFLELMELEKKGKEINENIYKVLEGLI
jgi:type I restriction enzyme M protein